MQNIQIVIQFPGSKTKDEFIEPEVLNVWEFTPGKISGETMAHILAGIARELATRCEQF